MRRVFTSMAVLALLVAPSFSFAGDILWDQAPDTAAVAAVDQQFGDFPDFSTYLVNDATFNTDVTVDSVTTYFTNGNAGAWLAVTQGVLNIFDPNLDDTDNPMSGGDFGPGLINVSVTDLGNNVLAVTASGLNINLGAGTYWFGLTPDAGFATLGQEFHYDSGSTVGFNTQYRNPLGGFGLPAGTSWGDANDLVPDYGDAALTITGTSTVIPEPTTAGLLVLGLVGLVARRRR